MKIDWIAKLQHLLQVLAFCLAIATIQYAFQPERPYGPPVVYSLFIGTFTWAFIDLGRHLFASSAETGWPKGIAGVGVVVVGIAAGYALGNFAGNQWCLHFGLYSGGPPLDRQAELRNSILITALAGIVGSYYFYSASKSAYLERRMTEAHQHATEARLKLLESQLEPHMLFNTLANLRALIGAWARAWTIRCSCRSVTALIAEDEPLLARELQVELARAWPQLRIAGTVGDGASAVVQALALKPDVLFFDIRMPGQSGLDAAAELTDEWPQELPFPALVFVTAYDQYAVQAFETRAVDYVLKPVQAARLQKTVARVQDVLARRAQGGADFEATLGQLRSLLRSVPPLAPQTGSPSQGGTLKLIQVSVGNSIRMVPAEEVVYFEAAYKYVRVVTEGHEYLIRTPLKELLPQLDAQHFWQVHRGTVVRADAIAGVTRDEAGKLHLQLRTRKEELAVSRLYAHLFKAM